MTPQRLVAVVVVSGLTAAMFATAASAQGPATAGYVVPTDSINVNGMIDSSEIQAVIDGLGDTLGTVFLPSRQTYNIDSTITLNKHGVTLMGEGHGVSSAGGTRLPIAGNVEAVLITGCTGCGLRGLSFAGTPAHATNVVRITACTNAFLDDVRIANAYRGVEITNAVGPLLQDVNLRGMTGDYGFYIHGVSGGKVDAAQLHRVSGSVSKGANEQVDWLLVGPRVDSVEVQSGRFIAGRRGMRLVGGSATEYGPKYVFTNKLGVDNTGLEGVLVEAGNDLLMMNTWIGQNDTLSGFVIGPGFTGGAVLTNLRIRGAGLHGLEINGGRDVGISNPLIGANGTAQAAGSMTSAGIYIGPGVSFLRVTGGRVGPLYGQGSGARQYYGIKFEGTDAETDLKDVKITGVSTMGNTVPFAPAGLVGTP